jgi:hypothetical protein
MTASASLQQEGARRKASTSLQQAGLRRTESKMLRKFWPAERAFLRALAYEGEA